MDWWTRKCGGRDVLQIAIPLVVSTMSYTIMQFCDRLFLAWHDTLDLAAVVPAGVLSWTVMSLPMGVAMYATTFVAQYFGAEAQHRIGPVIWQTVWIGIFTIPIFLVIGSFGETFFRAVGHSETLIGREATYFWVLSIGSAASVINAGLGSFWTGRGDTMTVMYVNLFGAMLNILIDYPLIFGLTVGNTEVLAERGIQGAAIATTLSLWATTTVFFCLFLRERYRREFETVSGCRFDLGLLQRIFRFGLPNGFQFFIEGGAITVFVLIMAQISDEASAATALAFSVNMIVFVPILGLSFAITTLVGQQIGDGHPEMASRATWTGFWIGMAYSSVFAVLYMLIPGAFLALHEAGAEDFQNIKELATLLMAFVAAYCIFDTVQIMFVAAIKGAGDTLFVVLFTVVSSSLFLASGGLISWYTTDTNIQFWGWWVCLTGWIVLLSAAYFWRFLQGRWKSMKVIEPELI